MKKKKLKKGIKKILWISTIILLFLSIGLYSAVKIYKQKEYEKTNEYKLITKGYELKDAQELIKNFKKEEIEYFLKNEKNNLYLDLLKEKYFIYDNFYRYIDYFNKETSHSLTDIIEIINTNTDYEYYSNTKETDISKKELMLVNKYYQLKEDYAPENLKVIPTTYAWGELGSQQVIEEVYDAFLNLWNDANKNGYYLMVSSSYRNYQKQQLVYDDYKNSYGTEYADSIAARAGYSEHQTGYTIDMFEKGSTQKTFHTTDCYKWLLDNAHKYGFILRYPEDKEKITGYNFESWHYRYVGIDAATYIYNNKITFDEYYAYFVK